MEMQLDQAIEVLKMVESRGLADDAKKTAIDVMERLLTHVNYEDDRCICKYCTDTECLRKR